MKMYVRTYRLTTTTDILGMSANDPELFENFIASKAPDAKTMEEEIAEHGVDEIVDKGITVFPMHPATGNPCLYDYQIKGFFKESCKFLSKEKGTKSSGLKAYKQAINGNIFPLNRHIDIDTPGKGRIFQRPLRVEGPGGVRVCLAASESIPPKATLILRVGALSESWFDYVEEWLDYGELHGLGQWRNASYGRFTWEKLSSEHGDFHPENF